MFSHQFDDLDKLNLNFTKSQWFPFARGLTSHTCEVRANGNHFVKLRSSISKLSNFITCNIIIEVAPVSGYAPKGSVRVGKGKAKVRQVPTFN